MMGGDVSKCDENVTLDSLLLSFHWLKLHFLPPPLFSSMLLRIHLVAHFKYCGSHHPISFFSKRSLSHHKHQDDAQPIKNDKSTSRAKSVLNESREGSSRDSSDLSSSLGNTFVHYKKYSNEMTKHFQAKKYSRVIQIFERIQSDPKLNGANIYTYNLALRALILMEMPSANVFNLFGEMQKNRM